MDMGIVGYGYWGPNVLRNFIRLEGINVRWVCDLKKDRTEIAKKEYPSVQISTRYEDMLGSPVEAVAISTPLDTH
jgi:predicted dehydrogenase